LNYLFVGKLFPVHILGGYLRDDPEGDAEDECEKEMIKVRGNTPEHKVEARIDLPGLQASNIIIHSNHFIIFELFRIRIYYYY